MIRFIIGDPGSGKSELIYDSVREDICSGHRVLLVVPEQEVLGAERIMAYRLESANSLALEVVSFRRLCNLIFRECGGLCRNYISRSGQSVMMWRALDDLRASLKYYAASDISDGGFIDRLLAFVGQLRAYKISPERFADAASCVGSGLLSAKASDLAAIFLRYDALVHESFDDSGEDIARAHDTLLENSFFDGCRVYIDSFYGFTPAELDIVSDIFAGADEVAVSLLSPGTGEYIRPQTTLKQLTELARQSGKKLGEIHLTVAKRYKNSLLKSAADSLWSDDKPPLNIGQEVITVAECADCYQEAAWIAADIRRCLRSGMRCREIAVISRGTEALRGILDEALAGQGIPYHMSARCDIAVYPVVRFLLTALRIIDGGWKAQDMITYIKTGIPGFDCNEINTLENYVTMWDISGRSRWEALWSMNPRGFMLERGEADNLLLDKVNALRARIYEPLAALAESLAGRGAVSDAARSLYGFMCDAGARNYMEASGDADAWNCICDALDSLCICGGQTKTDTASLLSLLKTIFAHSSIGSIPASADEVSIADASLARVSGIKRVYLCCVNDGVFPAPVGNDILFADREYEQMRDAGLTLSDTRETRANDELFYFGKAFSCASQSVCVTYSQHDPQGKKLTPSNVTERITSFTASQKPVNVEQLSPLALTESAEAARRSLYAREGTAFGDALKELFGGDKDRKTASLVHADEKLEPRTSRLLYSADIALTQSRTQTFIDCPFKHTCTYILRLPEIKENRFNAADIGTFVHAVLERYFSGLSTDDIAQIPLPTAQSAPEIDVIISEYIRSCLGADSQLNARAEAMFRRLRRMSVNAAADILREFRESDFRPAYYELGIGTRENDLVEPLRVQVDDESRAFVYGKIDRVDTCNIGGNTYVRITDYKTGKKEFGVNDAEKSKNLQMLLYLFSVCSNENSALKSQLGCTGKLIPAGVEYYMACSKNSIIRKAGDIPPEGADGLVFMRSGFVCSEPDVVCALDHSENKKWLPRRKEDNVNPQYADAEKFAALEETVKQQLAGISQRMKTGDCSLSDLSPGSNGSPCKYCAYRSVCRTEE